MKKHEIYKMWEFPKWISSHVYFISFMISYDWYVICSLKEVKYRIDVKIYQENVIAKVKLKLSL